MKALVHGNLIDGNGGDPIRDATLVVDDDGRIAQIGSDVEPPPGTEVIDVSGRTIMPGMIDCHVHFFIELRPMQEPALTPLTTVVLRAANNARKTLDAGVTSVRDAGGTPYGFKLGATQGLISSPRMKIAVSILAQTGGHGDPLLPSGIRIPRRVAMEGSTEWPDSICDGVEEVRKTSREVLRAGADFIKLSATGGVLSPTDEPGSTQFTREEISVMVQEAAAQGKTCMAHAQGTEGIRNAVECGVESIEHGIYLNEEVAGEMTKRGTFLVPTFHAPLGILKAEETTPGTVLPQSLRKAKEVIVDHATNVKLAYESGVKIAMGTDAGVGLHGTNAEELEYLVNLTGMSSMEAIVAATKTAS